MKIISLRTENVKRISVVEIRPDGSPIVVIGGKNGAGKSSVLDSIEMALNGAASMPRKPVRTGQDKAKVTLDLGDLVVTRTVTAAGKTTLTVENADGAIYKSPQALLDSLIGRLSFDPLAFEAMKPVQQREELRRLVGLKTDDLDREHALYYEERTAQNKTVKRIEQDIADRHVHGDTPAEEISVTALAAELSAAEESTRALDKARATYEAAVKEHTAAGALLALEQTALADLQARLDALQVKVTERTRAVTAAAQAIEQAKADGVKARSAVVDVEPIRQQIATAEATNARVRENRERAALVQTLRTERQVAEDLTAKLDDIAKQKAARIAAATFPVPGLSVDEEGVLFNGEPFEQASQAERLRVSVAMGLALNPKLKVLLVREGSALDSTGMQLLADLAAAADAQVWVERVAESSAGVSVLIEDGAVKREAVPA